MSHALKGGAGVGWRITGVGQKLTPLDGDVLGRGGAASVQRALDIVGALTIIAVALPLLLFIALAVALTSRGPILFKQGRIGRDGSVFSCWKFRTMVIDAEQRLADLLSRDASAREEWSRDHKLRRDPRVTLIGRLLRKSSLDELPQLFNVLQGKMSLVGPRPIVVSECNRYGRYFSHYCAVRPGITGLWQISGRNDVSYRRRVAFDVIYSRKRSVAMDIRILALTLPCVAFQKGAY